MRVLPAPIVWALVWLLVAALGACDRTVPPREPSQTRFTEAHAARLVPVACDYPDEPERRGSVRVRCYKAYLNPSPAHYTRVTVLSPDTDSPRFARHALISVPGGPGQGAMTDVYWLNHWLDWYAEEGADTDLVLYDPRGTSGSSSYWSCRAYAEALARSLAEGASIKQERDIIEPALAPCLEAYDQWLKQNAQIAEGIFALSTEHNAEDLRALITVLDYERVSLLGTSYGTRVALRAASHQKVHMLLLDSPYPFQHGTALDWPHIRQNVLRLHAQQFALRYGGAKGSYGDLREQLRQRLHELPVQFRLQHWGNGRYYPFLLTRYRLHDLELQALYRAEDLSDYYRALLRFLDGDDGDIQDLLERFLTNALDGEFSHLVYFATECNDNRMVSEADFLVASSEAPLDDINWLDFYHADACLLPIFQRVTSRNSVQAWSYDVGDKPSLIFSGALDPVTPAAWAEDLRAALASARLVSVEHVGHGVLGSGACPWSDILELMATASTMGELRCGAAEPRVAEPSAANSISRDAIPAP